jgi:hypothetical protein
MQHLRRSREVVILPHDLKHIAKLLQLHRLSGMPKASGRITAYSVREYP